jgi:hypothetical protein
MLARHSPASTEDRLRHARNEEHVDDESDKDHRAGDEVGEPHLHRIVPVECLLNEGVQEPGPDEDEGRCDCPDHGEADEHIEEAKELRPERLCHEQRDKDRSE